ncbi:hypothetical protein BOW53_02790 [Solemya pervernicosa gill symbiont]|uniref:Uncharacterized protein n=2 Tax=Gammaproteobacteria incertae sedis TaxID=118884 RepID=A0A1T2L9E1_9GAMM|nr:hypothetical protein BOW53_02790 [Solemya pervernicosa gill symbiont]QKQ28249.1 hypothetical protein HUE57_11760 [Candidatus Reidiella endopervernicosa]
MSIYSVNKLIAEARRIAADYRRATGKTLSGVSSEIALHDACHHLDLELEKEPVSGFDAVGHGKRDGQRVQIKARAIFDEKKGGQRIGQLKLDKEWDLLVLVLLNEDFESFEIYEADRQSIEEALNENSSSSARSKRGAMSVARFRNIGHLVWTPEEGEVEDDEVWENRGG